MALSTCKMLIKFNKQWNSFFGVKSFRNLNISEMVSLFNSLWSLFKNIFSNYIPHKTIICDDKYPPWINNNIQAVNSREKQYLQKLHFK